MGGVSCPKYQMFYQLLATNGQDQKATLGVFDLTRSGVIWRHDYLTVLVRERIPSPLSCLLTIVGSGVRDNADITIPILPHPPLPDNTTRLLITVMEASAITFCSLASAVSVRPDEV